MSKKNYNLKKSDLKEINYFDQTDTPDGMIRKQVQDFNDYNLAEFELYVPETTGETTNPLNQGRNCPACAGRLVVSEFEQPEDTLHLQCTNCGKFFYASDIDHRSETVDSIYKSISDRTFQKWERFMDKRL